MSNTKHCLVCGKEFKPCNTCSRNVDDMYNWRKVVCCQEHFYYHVPIIDYIRKNISKADAKKELEQAIKDYGEITFAENIANVVNEILAEDKKIKKHTKMLNEVVIPNISNDIGITEE